MSRDNNPSSAEYIVILKTITTSHRPPGPEKSVKHSCHCGRPESEELTDAISINILYLSNITLSFLWSTATGVIKASQILMNYVGFYCPAEIVPSFLSVQFQTLQGDDINFKFKCI